MEKDDAQRGGHLFSIINHLKSSYDDVNDDDDDDENIGRKQKRDAHPSEKAQETRRVRGALRVCRRISVRGRGDWR